MWNFAGRSKRSIRFHSEHVEPEPADSWKSGQHQFVAGDDPVPWHALPPLCQRQHHIAPCINLRRFWSNDLGYSPLRGPLRARFFSPHFVQCRSGSHCRLPMHYKNSGFRSPPPGIRVTCTCILTPPNTNSAFPASRSLFQFTNLPIHPRTPTCLCGNPTRKIPARSEGIGSGNRTPTTPDRQRVLQ